MLAPGGPFSCLTEPDQSLTYITSPDKSFVFLAKHSACSQETKIRPEKGNYDWDVVPKVICNMLRDFLKAHGKVDLTSGAVPRDGKSEQREGSICPLDCAMKASPPS